MPGDIDHINLGRMIIPLELNYCQCMLELEEYYEVIEHTDELLQKHRGKRGFRSLFEARVPCWLREECSIAACEPCCVQDGLINRTDFTPDLSDLSHVASQTLS